MTRKVESPALPCSADEAEFALRMVADFADDWETWEDATGSLRYVSPACLEFSSYSPEEYLQNQQLFYEIMHIDDQPSWQSHRHDVNSTPGRHKEAFRIIHRNGHVVWLEHTCQPIYASNGAYLGFRARNRDVSAQKVAEANLAATENLFQRIIDNLPFSLSIVAKDGTVLYANQRSLTLFELDPDELIGQRKAPILWIEPEQRQRWLQQIAEQGIVKDFEFQARTLNGKEFWVMGTGMMIQYQGQEAVLSTHHDITARKLAEEMLRHSEEKYRILFENATEAIVVVQDEILKLANPMAEYLSGFSIKEIMGKHFLDFAHPEDRHLMGRNHFLRLSGDNDNTTQQVFRLLRGDGGMRWVESKSLIISWDERPATLSFLIDITEQKLAQDALRDSEARLRTIVNTIPDGIAVTTLSGVIENASSQALKMWGITDAKDVIGKNVLEFVDPDEYDKARHYIDEMLRGNRRGPTEFLMLRQDGTTFHAECNADIIYDPDGQPVGVLYVNRDITQRKENERALLSSEAKYRFLTETISDVIWVYNVTQRCFSYISPSIEALRGLKVEEAMQESVDDTMTPPSAELIKDKLERGVPQLMNNPTQSVIERTEVQQYHRDGSLIWIEMVTKLQFNHAMEMEVLGVSRNVEERKRAEAEIRFLSFHDQLTGLYNRRYYEDEVIRLDVEENLPLTLVLADVNGLKLTNDAFGHVAGDRLLRDVAKIMRRECRGVDVLARIGGDEFVVLLPSTDAKEAEYFIQRVQKAMAELAPDPVKLSVSFGWSVKSSPAEQMDRIFTQAEGHMYQRKLVESANMRRETIQIVLGLLYQRNVLERDHARRVGDFCRRLALQVGLSQEEAEKVALAGELHDVGKIGIEPAILQKDGELDANEWWQIRRHPEIGYQILRSTTEYGEMADWVLAHHERMDGQGYPRGIKASELPVQARIIALCEAYAAMTEGRTYRDALTREVAFGILQDEAGHQFDPFLTEVFLNQVI